MKNKNVLICEEINDKNLSLLFNDEICALTIPNYCTSKAFEKAKRYIEHIETESLRSMYVGYKEGKITRQFFGVNIFGYTYNNTYNEEEDSEHVKFYYESALKNIKKMRSFISPYLAPVDKLRLEIDENWAFSARIANFHTKNMFVGACRIMKAEESYIGSIQPHIDSLPKNISSLRKQFSANIYFHIPPKGGELEIWNVSPLNHQEVTKLNIDQDWRSSLPASIKIKPNPGDLILFNTRRPHSICGFDEGIRSSIQCFIGINEDNSLVLWN